MPLMSRKLVGAILKGRLMNEPEKYPEGVYLHSMQAVRCKNSPLIEGVGFRITMAFLHTFFFFFFSFSSTSISVILLSNFKSPIFTSVWSLTNTCSTRILFQIPSRIYFYSTNKNLSEYTIRMKRLKLGRVSWQARLAC